MYTTSIVKDTRACEPCMTMCELHTHRLTCSYVSCLCNGPQVCTDTKARPASWHVAVHGSVSPKDPPSHHPGVRGPPLRRCVFSRTFTGSTLEAVGSVIELPALERVSPLVKNLTGEEGISWERNQFLFRPVQTPSPLSLQHPEQDDGGSFSALLRYYSVMSTSL